MKRSELLFALGRIFIDISATYVALLAAYAIRMKWFALVGLEPPVTLFPLTSYYGFSLKVVAAIFLIFVLNGRYRYEADEKYADEMLSVTMVYTFAFGILVVLFYFSQFYFFSRFIFGLAWMMGLLGILLGRAGLRWVRQWLWTKGYGRSRLLLMGVGKMAREVLGFLSNEPRYEIVGVLSEKHSRVKTFEKLPILGTFDELERLLKREEFDEILLATDHASDNLTAKCVRTAHIHHTKFRFLPDELGLDFATLEVSTFGDYPVMTLLNTRLRGWGVIIKSILDFVLAGAFVVILSPLLLAIAIAVKCEYPGVSIFYRSERIGKRGQKFQCLKFRSMIPDADKKKSKLLEKNQRKGDILFKIKDDPRITRVGRFLRTWSLDELPQFFNVLRGEMSVIGPRPHLPEEVKKYPKDDLRILSLKPGITGFAQINGRSGLSFEQEMKYELFYLKRWSLWLDGVIFLKTIWVMVTRKNAH